MNYPGHIRIIGGEFKGRKIPVLSAKALRPTPDRVRETLFNWLQGKLVGSRCLDLFAGTGILGFESLSRGAHLVDMIDCDPKIVATLKQTREILKIPAAHCNIILQDVREWLKGQANANPYDLIFLDPPFDSTLLEECLDILMGGSLISERTKIYVELPVDKTLPRNEQFIHLKMQKAGKVAYHLLQSAKIAS